MDRNFPLWLAWACFGSYLVWLVWSRFRPLALEGPAAPPEPRPAPPAWLFCEDGAALDRRVRWFAVRPGGETLLGGQPRADTAAAAYVYLSADDLLEEHAAIRFNPDSGRYEVEALAEGEVRHNNQVLRSGDAAALADGDTLDLGRISRFRFTLSRPEDA